jgi:ribosome production factor 1
VQKARQHGEPRPAGQGAFAQPVAHWQQAQAERNDGSVPAAKKARQKELRQKRIKEAAELGEEEQAAKQTPKTIDNTRELEPTLVPLEGDPEVEADEADGEFMPYFAGGVKPKVLVTTRPKLSQNLFHFIADLQKLIPALHFYPRKSYSVKEICQFAANRDFTQLVVLSEKSKVCNGMTISHLRKHDDDAGVGLAGPTAFFKLTHVVTSKDIPNHGASASHMPELNLHGFGTRLGHRVGRLLGSHFPHDAQFHGRQVVTFHSQRDFMFVRHHRYVFKEMNDKAKQAVKKATGLFGNGSILFATSGPSTGNCASFHRSLFRSLSRQILRVVDV